MKRVIKVPIASVITAEDNSTKRRLPNSAPKCLAKRCPIGTIGTISAKIVLTVKAIEKPRKNPLHETDPVAASGMTKESTPFMMSDIQRSITSSNFDIFFKKITSV